MNQTLLQHDSKLKYTSANAYHQYPQQQSTTANTSTKSAGSDESVSQSPCTSIPVIDSKYYVVPIGNRKRTLDAITEDKVMKDLQAYQTLFVYDHNNNNNNSSNHSSYTDDSNKTNDQTNVPVRQSSSSSSPKSSTVTDHHPPTLIPTLQQQPQLAQRLELGSKGRYFEVVWKEQDFIDKYNLNL